MKTQYTVSLPHTAWNIFRHPLICLGVAVGMMRDWLLPCLLLCGLSAVAQPSFTTFTQWTNVPASVATTISSNLPTFSAQTLTIRPGWGVAVSMLIGGTNVGGTLYGAVSIDGTNWGSATMPLTFTNLSNAYVFTTNIPAAVLDGFRVFRFASVTNQSATPLYITNLMAGRGIR